MSYNKTKTGIFLLFCNIDLYASISVSKVSSVVKAADSQILKCNSNSCINCSFFIGTLRRVLLSTCCMIYECRLCCVELWHLYWKQSDTTPHNKVFTLRLCVRWKIVMGLSSDNECYWLMAPDDTYTYVCTYVHACLHTYVRTCYLAMSWLASMLLHKTYRFKSTFCSLLRWDEWLPGRATECFCKQWWLPV